MNTFRSRTRSAKSYDLLPPERQKPRPALERMARPADVEDAEFVVIREPARSPEPRTPGPAKRPVRPQNDNGGMRRPRPAAATTDIAWKKRATLGVRASERLLGMLSGNLFSSLVALVFMIVFAMTGGFAALAGTGTTGDMRNPVDFTHVSVIQRNVNGIPMTVLSGIVENNGDVALASPSLRANFYSGGVMVSTTLFNPRLGTIETGDSRGFQVKLPQARGKMLDVQLSLAE